MEENLHEIGILTEEYPYYSLLYFKRAKLLSENKNEDYKNTLKLASIYAPNRRKLQEFIENPTDYRKQIVVHPEWLAEETSMYSQDYNLNLNDEELLKEVLTLEEPKFTPMPETPIVKEVSEIEEILSHFTEETSVQNNTIQEIEQLKQTIQQNQEKARMALFQSNHKENTYPTDVSTFISEETETLQEIVTTEKTQELIEITDQDSIIQLSEQEPKQGLNTETQQEPVSLNVPKIKQWFEEELKAVRLEKEEKENEIMQATKTEQEELIIEPLETEAVDVTVDGYISWLDELLGMENKSKKTTETKTNLDKKSIQDSIIDKFLQNQPKISKPNLTEDPIVEDKTESQNLEYEDIASETLAKIFVMQRQYDRAIRIYNVLITKNPSQKEQYQEIIKEIESKMNG